jgi:hypothetical protein
MLAREAVFGRVCHSWEKENSLIVGAEEVMMCYRRMTEEILIIII